MCASLVASASSPEKAALSAGDVVKITVYNHPDLTTTARIDNAGNITFPLLGASKIAGMSTAEAEATLAQLLKKGKFVENPQVNLFVERYRTPMVSILGEVHRPGKYAAKDPNTENIKTLTDVLALAGGVNANAADYLTVLRKSDADAPADEKQKVDLVSLLREGDISQNVPIADGDVVFVPRMDVFYIYGEVQKPGVFRLERGMTVMQALSVGGGLTPRGTQRGIRVNRRDRDNKIQTLRVGLMDAVKSDDVIFVKESIF